MSELAFGDLAGAAELRVFDRRLAAVAERYATAESPEHRRQLATLLRARGACWRAEHLRRTNVLAGIVETDDDAALDLAAELVVRVDGGGADQ